jgi:hypothetical protein
VFSAFRRERVDLDVDSCLRRVYDRYFTRLQYAKQIHALHRAIVEDVSSEGGTFEQTFWTREDGVGAWTLGVGAAFALFARVRAAPKPGVFAPGERPDVTAALLPAESATVFERIVVDTLDDLHLDSSWNFDAGYGSFDRLERAGGFDDTVPAIPR